MFVSARVRIAVIVAAVLLVLVFAADQLTSSPLLCGSCHEMSPRAHAWSVSPHSNVKCVSCHVGPHAWYQFPQKLVAQTQLVDRDLMRHLSGGYPDPVDARLAGQSPMPDAVCLQCHDPNRRATSGFRILIDHAKHAKRNGSCVSCHITVAHPKPTRGTAMSFMSQCFTCHGMSKAAKAPATCSLCHPADYKLLPASHQKAATWKRNHGKTALSDPRQCDMCHKPSFCYGCHGVAMPHPKGWAKRSGHPVFAQRDRKVCERCHGSSPNMCSMCHHKPYNPADGPWVKLHFQVVREKGATFCIGCHSPIYCANCHVGGKLSS